jgi:hypothetical protein
LFYVIICNSFSFHFVFAIDDVEVEGEAAFDDGGCDEDAAISVPIEMEELPEGANANEEGSGQPLAEGGGALSPLSGAYLLIVLAEPISEKHKVKMIQKLRQGKIVFYLLHQKNET